MSIKIADRLKPFSHNPGVEFPIPFTKIGVQVFPTALRLLPKGDLIHLPLKGPVEDFTAILDLQRGAIKVFGRTAEGDFRYWLFGKGQELYFYQEKGPEGILANSPFLEASSKPLVDQPMEMVSFGVSKKLDWELVKRRNNLAEFLPIWFQLGQLMPPVNDSCAGNSLYDSLKLGQNTMFNALFSAGFRGIFWPQKEDLSYGGYALPPLSAASEPTLLLTGGYHSIRSLLIQESMEALSILPTATKLFHAGRAMALQTSFASIDLEWAQGRLKKIYLSCKQTGHYQLNLPKEIKRFQVTSENRSFPMRALDPLNLTIKTEYLFDHFER